MLPEELEKINRSFAKLHDTQLARNAMTVVAGSVFSIVSLSPIDNVAAPLCFIGTGYSIFAIFLDMITRYQNWKTYYLINSLEGMNPKNIEYQKDEITALAEQLHQNYFMNVVFGVNGGIALAQMLSGNTNGFLSGGIFAVCAFFMSQLIGKNRMLLSCLDENVKISIKNYFDYLENRNHIKDLELLAHVKGKALSFHFPSGKRQEILYP